MGSAECVKRDVGVELGRLRFGRWAMRGWRG